MEKNYLSIGVLSKLTGVHIKSLRYYEKIGVLKPVYVNPESNYRYYSYQQIAVVMAIRLCVVLDIPLKDFHHYMDDESINYENLLQDGKSLIEEKLQGMQKALENLDLAIAETQLTEQQKPGELYVRHLYEKNVLTSKLEADYNLLDSSSIIALFEKAEKMGMETGYEIGYFSEYLDGKHQNYIFLEVEADASEHPDMVHFPAGEYVCLMGRNLSLKDLPEKFSTIIQSKSTARIIETELFTKTAQDELTMIELRMLI